MKCARCSGSGQEPEAPIVLACPVCEARKPLLPDDIRYLIDGYLTSVPSWTLSKAICGVVNSRFDTMGKTGADGEVR